MKMKIKKFYEARLYIGCYDNKNGRFSEDELTAFIKEAQEAHKTMIPVRVTKTKYISGTYYQEESWEISAINYPRIDTTPTDINNFMAYLAGKLIKRFNQHRICIINPNDVIMVEP